MSCRHIGLLALLAIGCGVRTNESHRNAKAERRISERVEGFDRFVDVGVWLRVVKADPKGQVLRKGWRPMVVLDERRFGGVIDTKADRPDICGPSLSPTEWFCSPDQFPLILHPDDAPRGQLAIGSEGSGKTTTLVMWHYRRWLENMGEDREAGQTAPVLKRLGLVKKEFIKLWPRKWRRYVKRDDFEGFELCDRSTIRFQHTHRQSAADGSPIQGFNWSWAGRDEMQDQIWVHDDINSRGRAAKNGGTYYKQFATATAKDDPEWRNLRDALKNGGAWNVSKLLIQNSPFVDPDFLDTQRKSGITDREFKRRFLAEDVPPESRVYYTWDRAKHLRPVPLVGARKITSIVLRRKTNNPRHALLIGNDPGIAKAASIFLDAYEIRGIADPVWWVRAELFTLHKSTEQHAKEVLKISQDRFGCNVRPDAEMAHVRSQPVGQADDRPDLNVYRIFNRVGLDVKAAQYAKNGQGTGHIKRESRIEMVLSLLEHGRLYIDVDDRGRPVAPKLVEAFETMERDEKGRSEHEAKDEHDPTDAPCALGYALWPWEKEAATALRATVREDVRHA